MIDLESEIPASTIKFDGLDDLVSPDYEECSTEKCIKSKSDDEDADVIIEEQKFEDHIYESNSNDFDEEEHNGRIIEIAEEVVYTCSSCNFGFESIENHIREFHNNQDIVYEMDEEEDDLIHNLEKDVTNIVESSTYSKESPKGKDIVKIEEESLSGDSIIDETTEGIRDEEDGVEYIEYNENADDSQEMISDEKYVDANGKMYIRKTIKLGTYVLNEIDTSKKEVSKNKCTHCEFTFPNLKSFTAHMLTHGKDNHKKKETDVFECTICNTVFKSNKSLRLHARMHFPVKSKSLDPLASLSPAVSSKSKSLSTTPSTSSATDNNKNKSLVRTFMCNICDKIFNKEFKEIHMATHSDEPEYNCTICNRKFKNEANLKMHSNAHQEVKPVIKQRESHNKNLTTPYACGYCDRKFARPHEKVKHERIHTGEKPYSCDICGKTFRVSYCLTLHMRTHQNFRPYVCPHCKKKFKAHSVYNHHLMTHSSERNYQCPFCTKTFKTSVQLAGHKNSHTKPFSCTECNRPFATLYSVRAHIETHKKANNNLRYKCQECGAKYARFFALRDHLKEQHNQTDVINETSHDSQLADEQTAAATATIIRDQDIVSVRSVLAQSNDVNEDDDLLVQDITEFEVENVEIVTDWL